METIEKVADNYVKDINTLYKVVGKDCFIKGAKWQKEQLTDWKKQLEATNLYYEDKIAKMYTEEEVIALLNELRQSIHPNKEGKAIYLEVDDIEPVIDRKSVV